MNNEMININANLVNDVRVSPFIREDQKVEVANFTLVKKYVDVKEYINCSAYGDKVYKNFIVKSLNKIEKTSNKEGE